MTNKCLLAAVLLLTLASCGPTVKLSPEYKKLSPERVALLPATASDDFRTQRIQLFKRLVIDQLRNRGFRLLDDSIVNRECSSPDCPNRSQLASKYDLHGFIILELDSTSQSDFGVGYYNEISATLRFHNKLAEELASVSHTESERGGVLFDSGQVLQGLIQQYGNFGDDRFNQLAERLSRTLVKQIPAPKQVGARESEMVQLLEVEAEKYRDGVYKICAYGTPESAVSLVFKRNRSNLREVEAGKYCGIFPVEEAAKSSLWVELTSAFGAPTRRRLNFNSTQIATK
jgi:hypothetical protein